MSEKKNEHKKSKDEKTHYLEIKKRRADLNNRNQRDMIDQQLDDGDENAISEEKRRYEARITELEKELQVESNKRQNAEKRIRELQTQIDEEHKPTDGLKIILGTKLNIFRYHLYKIIISKIRYFSQYIRYYINYFRYCINFNP